MSAMDTGRAHRVGRRGGPRPAHSIWPIVGGRRRRPRRRRAGDLPADVHLRHHRPARRDRRVDGRRPGASGPRPTSTYNAERPRAASPTRWSSRSSPPSASAIIVYSFSRIMLFLSKTSGPALFGVIAALVLARRLHRRLPARRSARRRSPPCAVDRRPRPRRRRRRRRARRASASCTRTRPPARSPPRASATRRRDRGRRARLADRRRQGQPHGRAHAARGRHADGHRPRRHRRAVDTVVVTRANPTNVLFRNESDEDRRLVLDLGTRPGDRRGPATRSPTAEVPNQQCTQLAEDGGSQLLTFSIAAPSCAADDAVPLRRARRRRRRGRGGGAVSERARAHEDAADGHG